jgi:O-antigen/teichoic acid export membrane protein
MAIGVARKLGAIGHLAQRKSSSDPWKRYAAISFATSLVSLPSAYLDRFLLAAFASTGAVGVLVVARQLQQLPAALYQMLLSVAAPMFSGAHARGARDELSHLYALITDWAVKAALPLVVFLTLFARPVLSLFGQQFAEVGALPLQIMMAAQLFNLASGPNGNVAIMCGLERDAFRVDVVMLLATAVLLAVLVPAYGLLGVAMSILANAILHNIWTLQIVRTKLQIRWWDRRYLSWVAPAVTVGVISLLAVRAIQTWSVPGLVFGLAAMYAAFSGVSYLQGLHSDDRELIAHIRRQLAFK